MIVLVCGSRTWSDYAAIRDRLTEFIDKAGVLHGGAAGADLLARRAADELGLSCYRMSPDYEQHGKAAPHVRNDQMLEQADRVIAFWDGKSRGTASVIAKARKRGLPVEVIGHDLLHSPVEDVR